MAGVGLSSLLAVVVASSLPGWPWVEPPAPATDPSPPIDEVSPARSTSEAPSESSTVPPESTATPAPSPPVSTTPAVVATAAAPAPAPARPIRWRLDASLGVAATRVTDDGFTGLSDRPSLLAAAPMLRLDWRVRPRGHLFLGGGVLYRGTRRSASVLAGAVHTQLRLNETLAFGRVSMMAIEGLDVFVDVGVGPSFARVDVASSGSNIHGETRDVLFAAEAAAGVSLYLPKAWLPRKQAGRATGGLSASLGYTLREPLRVDPALDREEDAIAIDALPWGDVSMRGLSWRFGVFVRFM